jgi:hypothetical protein
MITSAYIRTVCPVFGSGVEKEQKLNVALTLALDKLLSVLFEDTFQKLLDAQAGYPEPGYLMLLEKVAPYLAWESFAGYLIISQTTDTDAGLRVFNEAHSAEVEAKAVSATQGFATQRAEFYRGQIFRYMGANKALFPEYFRQATLCAAPPRTSFGVSSAGGRMRSVPSEIIKPY